MVVFGRAENAGSTSYPHPTGEHKQKELNRERQHDLDAGLAAHSANCGP